MEFKRPDLFKLQRDNLQPPENHFFDTLTKFFGACDDAWDIRIPNHKKKEALYSYITYPANALRILMLDAAADDLQHGRITAQTAEDIKQVINSSSPHSLKCSNDVVKMEKMHVLPKRQLHDKLKYYFEGEPMSPEAREWCLAQVEKLYEDSYKLASFTHILAGEDILSKWARGDELLYNRSVLSDGATLDEVLPPFIRLMAHLPSQISGVKKKDSLPGYMGRVQEAVTAAAPLLLEKLKLREQHLEALKIQKDAGTVVKEAAKNGNITQSPLPANGTIHTAKPASIPLTRNGTAIHSDAPPPVIPSMEVPPFRPAPLPSTTAWFKSLIHAQKLDAGHEYDCDKGQITIRCRAYPECHFEYRVKKGPNHIPEMAEQNYIAGELAAYRATMELYIDVVSALENELGFVRFPADNPTHLRHEGFGLAVPLAGGAYRALAQVTKAREEYDNAWLEKAAREEVKINGSVQPPSLAKPHRHNGVSHAHNGQPKSPEHEQTILVFDTCALKLFTAPRSLDEHKAARTWLDLIKKTAQLPNVKIVIPSFIADWEIIGRTALFQPDGTVNIRQFDEHRDSKTFKHFFDSASRARLDENGKLQIQKGSNRNIIIWESPHDRELHEAIHGIMDNDKLSTGEKWNKINADIRHKSEGEKCIESFLGEIPYHSPVVVISQDGGYFASRAKAGIHATQHGYPISESTVRPYIEAEVNVRRNDLVHMLHEWALTPHDLCEYFDYYSPPNQTTSAHKLHNIPGTYAAPFDAHRHVETMEEIIQKGVDMLPKKTMAVVPMSQTVSALNDTDITTIPSGLLNTATISVGALPAGMTATFDTTQAEELLRYTAHVKHGAVVSPYIDSVSQRMLRYLKDKFPTHKIGFDADDFKGDVSVRMHNEKDGMYVTLQCNDMGMRQRIQPVVDNFIKRHKPSESLIR